MNRLLIILALLSLACQLSAVPAAPEAKAVIQSAPLMPTANTAIITAASAVNVRNQPNEHGAWLGYKYTGDVVTVIECVGKWARIGDGRYINGRYIDNGVCQ